MKTPPVIVTRKVDDLIPYARNSRTHSDAQVAQIAASVREFAEVDADSTLAIAEVA